MMSSLFKRPWLAKPPAWLPAHSLIATHLLSLLCLVGVSDWAWRQALQAEQYQADFQQRQQRQGQAEQHLREQQHQSQQQQALDEQIHQQLAAADFATHDIETALDANPLLHWRSRWRIPDARDLAPDPQKQPVRVALSTDAPHENLLLDALQAAIQRSPYPLTGWQCDWQRQHSWMLPISAHCELTFQRFSDELLSRLGAPPATAHSPASATSATAAPLTLFFSLSEQAALLRDGSPDGPVRVNGIVRSSHGGTTVWVNGKAEYQPAQDNTATTQSGTTHWRVSHDGQDLLIPGLQGIRHLPIGQPPQASTGEQP